MLSLSLALIFLVSVFSLWLFQRNKKNGDYKEIPGPMGLPVLGHVLQLGSTMHLKFAQWAEQYGKIYQIRLGTRKVVIVSDPEWVKEMFGDIAFSGRRFFEGFEMYENEPLGIASIEGEMWQVHRRFLLRQLRDFGFGKRNMEELVMEEVKETISRLKSFPNGIVNDPKQVFQIAVLNSLWTIVGNRRFQHDDPEIQKMINDGNALMQLIMKNALVLFVPWTRIFMPISRAFAAARDKGRQFYVDAVDYHKETFQEDSPRDFIDVYLKEMKAEKDNPESMFYGDRAERQLHAVMADLFFAGNDTTSATLAWVLLYLAKYKHVQEKLQQEITKVTNNARHVTLDDRPSMPYTMAVMEETFRHSSILGAGAQHKALVDKEFKGYMIEKETWIFPNLYYIHHNNEIWENHEEFKPERFLHDNGKVFRRNENVLPFQIGRRQCVGEALARDTFFLYLTNIFQKFSIDFDPDSAEPDMIPIPGFILAPKEYAVKLTERDLK